MVQHWLALLTYEVTEVYARIKEETLVREWKQATAGLTRPNAWIRVILVLPLPKSSGVVPGSSDNTIAPGLMGWIARALSRRDLQRRERRPASDTRASKRRLARHGQGEGVPHREPAPFGLGRLERPVS
jgi:hypothetical protein